MRLKVGEHGLLIPRDMLHGIDEVSLFEHHGQVILVPIQQENELLKLGTEIVCDDPVPPGGVTNLDREIYDGR